ncbi:hypothetical protein GCM10010519_08040 [Streptomyces lactacystinicus]
MCGPDSAGMAHPPAAGLVDGAAPEAVPLLSDCSSDPPSEEQPPARASAASAAPDRRSERRDGRG